MLFSYSIGSPHVRNFFLLDILIGRKARSGLAYESWFLNKLSTVGFVFEKNVAATVNFLCCFLCLNPILFLSKHASKVLNPIISLKSLLEMEYSNIVYSLLDAVATVYLEI